jgi:hypothetical protein
LTKLESKALAVQTRGRSRNVQVRSIDPTTNAKVNGNFSIETEIFLFPGDSLEEYGVFVGA